jgi:general secretion pathway protein F
MKFRYNALNSTGKTENGVVEAEGESAARSEIKDKGLFLVSIREVAAKSEKRKMPFSFGLKQRLPIMLARQLASLLSGGVPLFQALTIIGNQLDGDKEKEIVGYLGEQVRGGTSLSDALKAYPDMFDELFVYSVRAGEKSGALDSILEYQAGLLENRAVVRGKIRAALVYPAIMSVVGFGVLVFLIGFVVPMVIKIFERTNQAVPIFTKILIGMAAILNNYYYVIILAVAAIYFGLRWAKRQPQGKSLWDRILLDLPVFGNFYVMVLINRFTRIMGTLLRSGIPLLQALLVVSGTMKNSIVSRAVTRMAEMVEEGANLSSALRDTRVFPGYVADMVAVGETGGNLGQMLDKVAEYYEANVSQRITAFTAMVEPAIILVMGAVVAFVLVSILLPLFEMNKILVGK